VHLVLENAPSAELKEVIAFCRSVGLPVCLRDLGVTEVTKEKIMAVAKGATVEGESIYNMPFPVDVDSVYAAIMAADLLGGSL
jgi:glycerol dehydrogenase